VLDASFLPLETDGSFFHLGGVYVFGGKAPSISELRAHVAARLHAAPRLRQRLKTAKFQSGRPIWIDDAEFSMDKHVVGVTLPSPAGDLELREFTAKVFSGPLDRSRPLWMMWLVDQFEQDRFAVVIQHHQAMADGVSSVDLAKLWFDAEPRGEPAEDTSGEWVPQPEPTDRELVARGLREYASAPKRMFSAVRRMAADPHKSLAGARVFMEGLRETGREFRTTAPQLPINEPIEADRRIAWLHLDLDEMLQVKNVFGCKVNDVFLAAAAGAMRAWMVGRQIDPDEVVMRFQVPVSYRAPDEHGLMGNRIVAMRVPIPTHLADPLERLRYVQRATSTIKQSSVSELTRTYYSVGEVLPPALLTPSARMGFSSKLYNMMVVNVAGPREQLYLIGRPLQTIVPLPQLPAKQGMAIVMLSYFGRVGIGFLSASNIVDDLDGIVSDFRVALDELDEVAATTSRR